MTEARLVLKKIQQKWMLIKVAEVTVLALGFGILTYLISVNILLSIGVFLAFVCVGFFLIKPNQYDLSKVCSYIDTTFPKMEFSSALLITAPMELSPLGKIQQHRVAEELNLQKSNIKFKNRIFINSCIAIALVLLGMGLRYSGLLNATTSIKNNIPESEIIQFQPLDSVVEANAAPTVVNQKIFISYPSYTNKNAISTSKMNLKVLEGSKINWNIEFDKAIEGAMLQFGEEQYPMLFLGEKYTKSLKAEYAAIYNLKFVDVLGNSYLSDLYALEIIKDEAPTLEVAGLGQFSSFEYDEAQILEFTTSVTDDFGIADMYIIATVSKGSGESVKFREEKLFFDSQVRKGVTKMLLKKKLDLQSLKMEPGDELYFYIEAKDYKEPKRNIGRTETYFAVIKDTVSNGFAVEGALGADLMPDYFRSQRQLIIDTEKLIADKPSLKEQEFNFTSNGLGFDQKALRLKYGELMGDESEGAFSSETNESQVEAESDENILDDYTHDHDGDNEHNLVEHDHEEETLDEEEEEGGPLEEYLHNHEDPEASTLFAKSLKSKLKQAMAEMWDAELYLRLYQPEKSLPYQYKALKLIQEIKNSARIYVHRIGFDPPPIQENKRLTGEIDEIQNFNKTEDLTNEEDYAFMRKAILRLEELINTKEAIKSADRTLFESAGNELATLAIVTPGKYLKTLQGLKWLSQAIKSSNKELSRVYEGLISAVPKKDASPNLENDFLSEMDVLLLQELTRNDQ